VGRSLAVTAIGNLHIDEKAAFDFFVVYARYEYAAKAARYVLKNMPEGRKLRKLELDLQTIADKIETGFRRAMRENRDLDSAVAYYQRFPLKAQVWNGKEPDWSLKEHTEPFPCDLLRRLAQTRNNLFHGGKGWEPEEKAIDRANLLISHGLLILEAVITSDVALNENFTSYD